jgi:hypothetical protein
MHLAALAPLKLFTNCQYRSHIDHIRQREYVLQCFAYKLKRLTAETDKKNNNLIKANKRLDKLFTVLPTI